MERAVYYDTLFDRFAKWTSRAAGNPATFIAAVLILLAWATTGPLFGFDYTNVVGLPLALTVRMLGAFGINPQ